MPMADIAEQFGTGNWAFTDDVAEVFDGHVRASVPFYDVTQDIVAAISDWVLPAGGLVADLGAATGTTTAMLLARHPERALRAALYDDQPTMLDQARRKLDPDGTLGTRITYCTARVEVGPYQHVDADLTLALWTLQFLPWPARAKALRLARKHAAPSGALLVAEKVRPVDPRWAEIGSDLSHDWKSDHGISDTAIRAKAQALRGVLMPLPVAALYDAVTDAGWTAVDTIWRWHNWVLIGAYATAHGYGWHGSRPTSG